MHWARRDEAESNMTGVLSSRAIIAILVEPLLMRTLTRHDDLFWLFQDVFKMPAVACYLYSASSLSVKHSTDSKRRLGRALLAWRALLI